MLYGLFQGVSYFLRLFRYALLIYCLLSWLLPPYHKVMRAFARVTDPLLAPIRRLLFRVFPQARIDITAIVAFLVIGLTESLLWRLYSLLR